MMSIPHNGSHHNVEIDFFRRVQADRYLFSGDGKHGNPEVATVASLIAARGCDEYRMYFTNRESSEKEFGPKLDEFFGKELPFKPNYRRVFRTPERGSVMIDLMDPMPY